MSFFKEHLKPVITLVVICIIVGGVLAAVNSFTAPIIEANEEKAALETYAKVLPEADSFTELECSIEGVETVLKADNGAGYIVVASAQGYGGDVPATVAFDNEGNILSLIMNENDETPGLGQKVTNEDFYSQFWGMAAENFTIDDIDAISGATISSKASVKAINLAIDAYNEVKEAQ